jgi:hypothetical protein
MSSRRVQICGGLALAVAAAGASVLFAQKENSPPPASLLPAHAVIYAGLDGGAGHLEAWKKTAAYEALYESGLAEVATKLINAVQEQSGGAQGIPGQVQSALTHLMDHGLSLAVTLGDANGPPAPWAILVLHEAAQFEPMLGQLAMNASRGEIQFETKKDGGRTITRGVIPNTPGVEIAWWSEKGHLVIVSGLNAVSAAVQVANGGPNITTDPLWAQYGAGKAEFEVTSVGWLDFATILNKVGGFPVPNLKKANAPGPVRVSELASVLGLDSLKSVAGRSGFKGPALWSEMNINASGERKGLLALVNQEPFTLSDLPPLPSSASGFAASSFNWAKAYDSILKVARDVAAYVPESKSDDVDRAISKMRDAIGFDLREDLFASLGNVHCIYADSNQLPFGLGFGLAVEVRDAGKLRKSVDLLLTALEKRAGRNVSIRRSDKYGQSLISLEFAEGAMTPALSIGDKWMSLGIVPQSVEAFLMREAGKLPRWAPSAEMKTILAEVPSSFTAITVSDPRDTYQMALGFAPFLMGAAQAGIRQSPAFPPDFRLPISTADIPPAELVTRPLFPNISVATTSPEGTIYTSRTSLPAAPFTGAVDGGTAFSTTAIMTALLLPAVQQAREAARRTQSRNNLKMLMLAMHNYHDTFQTFPEGTVPNEKLKSDERLSWITKLLPFVDQAALYEKIDFEEGWEDEPNAMLMMTRLPVLQNPSSSEPPGKYGTTNYVGIAGVGKDAPELPASSPRAGIFGYNRGTKLQDVRDGTSNTMAITDGKEGGPWGAGGKATIRALTEKPYINGPDGIGGPHVGGISAALADGSVRFISQNIDPKTFEALATINGGELIGDF